MSQTTLFTILDLGTLMSQIILCRFSLTVAVDSLFTYREVDITVIFIA